jgi:energy-coupling factor transporter transmembrane protein EcfT
VVTKINLKNINAAFKLIAFLIFIITLIIANTYTVLLGFILLVLILFYFDDNFTNLIKLNSYNLIPTILLFILILIFNNVFNALFITLKYIIFINYSAIYIRNTSECDLTDSILYLLKPFNRLFNTYRVATTIVWLMKYLPTYTIFSKRLNYNKKTHGYINNSYSLLRVIINKIKHHYQTFIITAVNAFSLERRMQIRGIDVPYKCNALKLKIGNHDIIYLAIHILLILLMLREVFI